MGLLFPSCWSRGRASAQVASSTERAQNAGAEQQPAGVAVALRTAHLIALVPALGDEAARSSWTWEALVRPPGRGEASGPPVRSSDGDLGWHLAAKQSNVAHALATWATRSLRQPCVRRAEPEDVRGRLGAQDGRRTSGHQSPTGRSLLRAARDRRPGATWRRVRPPIRHTPVTPTP